MPKHTHYGYNHDGNEVEVTHDHDHDGPPGNHDHPDRFAVIFHDEINRPPAQEAELQALERRVREASNMASRAERRTAMLEVHKAITAFGVRLVDQQPWDEAMALRVARAGRAALRWIEVD